MQWQEKAKQLPFGAKRKIPHCSTDASAYISNSPKGVRLYCFRCGCKDFEAHGRLSASDLHRMQKKDAELIEQKPVTQPLTEGPREAHAWVLKAGITPELAQSKYGFTWHASTHRVVIPIMQNEKFLHAWISRSIDGRKPKYLASRSSAGCSWYQLRRARKKTVVVVEDALSAIKCHQAGQNSLAVLGTSISQKTAFLLSHWKVIGWFDADAAGNAGFAKLRKALGPYGVEPSRIVSDRDPKMHTKGEINEKVSEHGD